MNRVKAEKQKETFRQVHARKHYKSYIWNCVLVEEPTTHEWIIEVYLKQSLPKNLKPKPPYGMRLRFVMLQT